MGRPVARKDERTFAVVMVATCIGLLALGGIGGWTARGIAEANKPAPPAPPAPLGGWLPAKGGAFYSINGELFDNPPPGRDFMYINPPPNDQAPHEVCLGAMCRPRLVFVAGKWRRDPPQ